MHPRTKHPLTFLVIDDDNDIAEAVSLGLKRQHHIVDSFSDPSIALADYTPGKYDLIILDVAMPKMNGFQLRRRILQVDPKARFLFLTAFHLPNSEFARMFPEADDVWVMEKPVSISILLKYAESVLDGQADGAATKTKAKASQSSAAAEIKRG